MGPKFRHLFSPRGAKKNCLMQGMTSAENVNFECKLSLQYAYLKPPHSKITSPQKKKKNHREMAVFKISFMTLALFIMAGILFSGNNVVSGQTCKGDFKNLVAQCMPYVQNPGPKTPPSKGCCNAVRTVDVPCACRHLPPGIGGNVSLEKVAYVLRVCGTPLKPGTKCGGN